MPEKKSGVKKSSMVEVSQSLFKIEENILTITNRKIEAGKTKTEEILF